MPGGWRCDNGVLNDLSWLWICCVKVKATVLSSLSLQCGKQIDPPRNARKTEKAEESSSAAAPILTVNLS